MWEKIKNNPARVLSALLSAAVIVAASVGVDISDLAATIGSIIVIVFGGEAVRAKVTPTRKLRK